MSLADLRKKTQSANKPAPAVEPDEPIVVNDDEAADEVAALKAKLAALEAAAKPAKAAAPESEPEPEVKEAEVHGFFEFIDQAAGQQHVGNMGLHQPDIRSGMRIRCRLQKVLDILREIFTNHINTSPEKS